MLQRSLPPSQIIFGIAAASAAGAVTVFPALAQASGNFDHRIEITPFKIFLMLFLMLGPIKILVPFDSLTRSLEPAHKRRIARRAVFFSAAALMTAAFLGRAMLDNFQISLPVLSLTGGIILFLMALQTVMQGGVPIPVDRQSEAGAESRLALMPLAFPIIVTPPGIAAVIVFATLADGQVEGSAIVVGIVLAILILNWIAMLFASTILKWAGTTLQIFGVVLGVNQVALGLQIILQNLNVIGIFAEKAQ